MTSLTLRNVEVNDHSGLDVRIEDGRITQIGRLGSSRHELDGGGGALIPGLCDHHVHLFGLAARSDSVVLDDVTTAEQLGAKIAASVATRPEGAWVRVLGYHETMAGELTRRDLDALAPRHRLRMQHQTGSLWILNSLALTALGPGESPPGLDREAGHIWRGDAWLRERIGAEAPPLAPIGRRLASYGITALTDASVTTDASSAWRLAQAVRDGDLPQRLMLMSGGALEAPSDGAFSVGPVKVLLDDHALPDFDDFVRRIGRARAWGRSVAVHCVTAGELALTLAAFEAAGTEKGDRIEHGGIIPADAIGPLQQMGLTVVTQSAFIRERGDRYAAQVEAIDQSSLYRCASLMTAGVSVAGSSDAPYASPDPWLGIAAAIDRRTAGGLMIGASERIKPREALALYLGEQAAPGRVARKVEVGAVADLCLLGAPISEVLQAPDAGRVKATIFGGRVVYDV